MVLCISKDLPFAQSRFCGANDIKNAKKLFLHFAVARVRQNNGVDITDSPIRGLRARAIIVLNEERQDKNYLYRLISLQKLPKNQIMMLAFSAIANFQV